MADARDQQDQPRRHDIVACLDGLIAQGVVLDEHTEDLRRSCQAESDPMKIQELIERFNDENEEIMQGEGDMQRLQDFHDGVSYSVLLCGCIYLIGMLKTVQLILFGVLLVFVLALFFNETEDGEPDLIPGELFWVEYGWLVVRYARLLWWCLLPSS